MAVEFEDYTVKVTDAMEEAALQFLEEASFEIESQAKRNSRVREGYLKGSWMHIVNTKAKESKVGSQQQNAIWEEFGTGEYALKGDGRRGGWYYEDDDGNWHFTKGKTPNRTLQKAFDKTKGKIINRARQLFSERMN